jgi:hypothetical protein
VTLDLACVAVLRRSAHRAGGFDVIVETIVGTAVEPIVETRSLCGRRSGPGQVSPAADVA